MLTAGQISGLTPSQFFYLYYWLFPPRQKNYIKSDTEIVKQSFLSILEQLTSPLVLHYVSILIIYCIAPLALAPISPCLPSAFYQLVPNSQSSAVYQLLPGSSDSCLHGLLACTW